MDKRIIELTRGWLLTQPKTTIKPAYCTQNQSRSIHQKGKVDYTTMSSGSHRSLVTLASFFQYSFSKKLTLNLFPSPFKISKN